MVSALLAESKSDMDKLNKGKAYKAKDGTKYMIFGAIDDIYNYVFVANFASNTVIRMLPKSAEDFIDRFNLKPIDIEIIEK